METNIKTAILRRHNGGNDAPNNIAAELGLTIEQVNAVIAEDRDTRERDAEIIRTYKNVGDAPVLAKRHGVDVAHVWRLIHKADLEKECARASEYAQAVMQAGQVVYALPASVLKTSAGTDAIVSALESAIKAQARDLGVLISIAVIPVEEIAGIKAAEPIENPRAVAASLQAKVVNAARKAELPA